MNQDFRSAVQSVERSLDNLDQQVRRFARRRPLIALAAALGSGYLLARAVSRL